MRICLISREYPPDTGWGGIGAYTYQHARALKEVGHDVVVISLTNKDSRVDVELLSDASDLSFVPIYRAAWHQLFADLSTIWISLPYSLFALKSGFALWRKFLQVHKESPFDVVEAPEHLGEALFASLCQICPLVVRLHTPHSKFIVEGYHNLCSTFDQQLLSMLERMTMLEADLLSSPSEDLANYVASDCGIARGSIEIVRNPVDCEKFTPEGDRALQPDDFVTVFFAGRLEERKGVHYLIEAIPLVLQKAPKVRFVIVGADTDTGPGMTSVLKSLNQSLVKSGVEDSVTFFSHVDLDQMASYYRSADICIVPSLYENAPYTVLEAQACGKPVVGTDAGGSKEYIQDGVTGIVVPARDAAALAEAVVKLAIDDALRLSMGNNARKVSLECFDKKVIVARALSTYAQAIERHSLKFDNALYRRDPQQSLNDFVVLLYDYHLNLCDLIYRHSLTFRVKTWMQLALSRPRLCLAKMMLSLLTNLTSKHKPIYRLEEFRQRLAAQIKEREFQRRDRVLKCLLGVKELVDSSIDRQAVFVTDSKK